MKASPNPSKGSVSLRIKSPTPFKGVVAFEEATNDSRAFAVTAALPQQQQQQQPSSSISLTQSQTPVESTTGSADLQTPNLNAASNPASQVSSLSTAPTPLVSNATASTTTASPTRHNSISTGTTATGTATSSLSPTRQFRSRRNKQHTFQTQGSSFKSSRRKRRRTPTTLKKTASDDQQPLGHQASTSSSIFYYLCCRDPTLARSTLSCMNVVAKMLMWCSVVASVTAVGWYSYDFKRHGTDEHLIAWFSAGAFVLLGFPISIYGIVMHLANYNQPNVQMYVVRILWMVPIYSIESWICLRYKDYAIYIETLRDFYESYVLYSFLQYLIQILGGEDALILMLKDKSPTRGSHMWGLQWCVKPWLMGQPLRKTYEYSPLMQPPQQPSAVHATNPSKPIATGDSVPTAMSEIKPIRSTALKRVHWTSPFFVKCKFGVLQYVLLKFVCSIVVMILERNHIYKEGDFTPRGGYLYICILTNLSQCWALYCLIFFYYATKTELGSIRPVGKFLSVKALVFFTWWQAVGISMLSQAGLVPYYYKGSFILGGYAEDSDEKDVLFNGPYVIEPMSVDDALALDSLGGAVLSNSSHFHYQPIQEQEWTAEEVAKGMQDWLICIEMFVAAIVHIYVFPHEEYDPQAVEARNRSLSQTPHKDWNKRLGRKWKEWDNKSGWSGTTHTSNSEVELGSLRAQTYTSHQAVPINSSFDEEDDLRIHPLDQMRDQRKNGSMAATLLGWGGGATSGEDDEDELLERRPLLDLGPTPMESDRENHSHEELDGGYNRGHGNDDDDSSAYTMESSELNDAEENSYSDEDLENPSADTSHPTPSTPRKPGFVKALLDSAIPQDLRDNTVGIINGDYVVEKKTLLHHAATSDSYDLFSRVGRHRPKISRPKPSFG